ncbi:MAG: hypothetical protein HGB03_00575 [Candidatus Yonathbacteria bacterium]|nr:hypothetical protein [Candidatus Yonathbacteria bacterium]NTW47757.1 hypothetical protein [Candidatus Yonathbacteria bacterium]
MIQHSFLRHLIGIMTMMSVVFPSTFVFAQEIETFNLNDMSDLTIVATVGVYNAHVISQNDQYVSVAFDIANGDMVQPDIRYGVEVVKKTTNGSSVIVDTVVYDEIVSLGAGEKVSRQVSYAIPAYLNGIYDVRILTETGKGLSLGEMTAGTVRFSGSSSISLDVATCYLSVGSEEARYTLRQGIDILPSEILSVTCQVTNTSSEKSVVPLFETYERSVFGNMISSSSGESFSIPAGISKVSFPLPVSDKPQAYDVRVSLTENGSPVTTPTIVHYVIQGDSATIQNIRLDKKMYSAGEVATVSFFISGMADQFPDSRAEEKSLEQTSLVVSMYDKDGVSCGDPVTVSSQDLDLSGVSISSVSVPVSVTCADPSVSVTLKDASGNTLDSSIVSTFMQSPEFTAWISLIVVIIAAIIILILVRRVGTKSSLTTVLLLGIIFSPMLIFAGGAGDGGINSVNTLKTDPVSTEKDTTTSTQETPLVTSFTATKKFETVTITVNANLNKQEYAPYEPVYIEGKATLSLCKNDWLNSDLFWAIESVPDTTFHSVNCRSQMDTDLCSSVSNLLEMSDEDYERTILGYHKSTFREDIREAILKIARISISLRNPVAPDKSKIGSLLSKAECSAFSYGERCKTSTLTTSKPAPEEPGIHQANVHFSGKTGESFRELDRGDVKKVFEADGILTFRVKGGTTPSVDLSAIPSVLPSGSVTDLRWTVSNATSCTATANPSSTTWEGLKSATGGAETSVGLYADTIFTITCTNDDFVSATDSVTVFVTDLPACSDGRDNDGDGWVDNEDPECVGGGTSESGIPVSVICADGIDNDTDGQIDGNDPGCVDSLDVDEYNEPISSETTSGGQGSGSTSSDGDTDPGDIDFKEF